jgi:acetaldehyde dehydrogenase
MGEEALAVVPGHPFLHIDEMMRATVMTRIPVAIVGPGNVGTDLMYKLLRSPVLDPRFMIGVNPSSAGLRRAQAEGVTVSSEGVDWLLNRPDTPLMVFEATTASVHARNATRYAQAGMTAIDLTPSAYGQPVVPPVNLDQDRLAPNISMVSCAGQATVPIVSAVSRLTPVTNAATTVTIAATSVGAGTHLNLETLVDTTVRAVETLGNAEHATSIIIIDPAEPPRCMRVEIVCTVPCATARTEARITASLMAMVSTVQRYVPGYQMVRPPLWDHSPDHQPRVTACLEVVGTADYLPAYAGNLDIITAAAVHVGESLAALVSAGKRPVPAP